MAYLTPQVRSAAELTIRTETYVRRILFEGTRAVGAEIARGAASEIVRGREIDPRLRDDPQPGRTDAQRRRRAGRARKARHSRRGGRCPASDAT